MTRLIAELSVATSISPNELLKAEPSIITAMIDVLEKQNRAFKK